MKNITPIIIIFIAIAGFSFFVQPLFDSAKPLQVEIGQYKAAIEKADLLASLTEAKVLAYNNLSPTSLDQLGKIIPDSSNVTHVLADINTLALKYGSAVGNVVVSNASPGSNRSVVGQTDVSFTFSATYPKLVLFMTDLEKSLRIMDIQSLSFKVGDKSVYDYKITIRIYSSSNQ